VPVLMVLFLGVAYGGLFLCALYRQQPIYLIKYFHLGADHVDFLEASRRLRDHLSPYASDRFVTPPLSSVLNLPLVSLDDHSAAAIFMLCNLLLVMGAVFWVQRSCSLAFTDRFASLVLPLLAAPTLMLFERGNIDGVVAACVAVFLVLLRRRLIAGLGLGFAAALKIYPLVLTIPLLIRKDYKAVGAAVLVIGISTVVFVGVVPDFIHNLRGRVAGYSLPENLSAFAIIYPIERLFPGMGLAIKAAYAVLICAILLVGVAFDWKGARGLSPLQGRVLVASYLPFTVNFPLLVYSYSGVMVLLMFVVMSDARVRLSSFSRMLLFTGSFLVFFPALAFDLTLGNSAATHLFNVLPPLGSTILLVLFVRLRIEWRAAMREGHIKVAGAG
jgi:hypothetical protein